ncbi:MAG: hypothetical protein IJ920_02710 [Paludibacteraceae bacterium]|nr:hypothetical protein [Paludibacteraceae bacterium]
MKKIYMLNNSKGVIGLLLGVKSRISPMRPLLTMLLILMVALFGVNESVWGLDQYVIVEDFNNSTKYDGTGLNHITSSGFSNKVNHVTFTIAGVAFSDSWGDNRLDYSSQSRNSELSSPITWEADPNYDVCVTKVLMGVRGYQSVISPKTANAYLTDGTTTTGTQDCKTNGTGTKTFEISAAKINSPLSLVKSTGGNSTTYKIPTITFTYKVTHKEYLFGFSASTGVNNGSYGSATATVAKSTVQAAIGETSASTTATFTATPAAGCQFLGWSTSSDGSTGYESTANLYTPTINNTTAGSTANKTLYAIFDNKQPQSITWNETLTGKVRGKVFTLNATASSGLAVTYTASPADLVSISGNQVTCLKAGTVTITANQAGNSSYHPSSNTPAKSFTIIEHAITKNPTATGITYEQTLSNSALSGGTANVDGTWAWKTPNIVPNAGTANYVAVFTPLSSVISAYPLECNVSVTVTKATPDVACTVNVNTHYVDDAKIDLSSAWTREGDGVITYSVISFAESGTNNSGGTTPFVENNQYLHLQKAGIAKVVMTIGVGTNYIARNETIDVVITKRSNTLYANSSASFAPTMYTDKTLDVTLTASNTDYAGSPISVEQVNAADTTIAKYEYSQASHSGTVTSRQFLASTSWHMTQPENYKYQAGSGSFTVSVANASEATNCYIVTNESDQIEKTVGNWLEDTPGKTINLDSRGSSLTFQARKSRNDAISQLFAQATKNGNDWYDLNSEALDLGTSNNTYGPYDVKDVKSIRFCVKSGGSYTKYIDHICVTRKTFLNVGTDNSSINGTLTINKKDGVSAIYPGEKGQQSTTVYWGIANGGNLKIKCDDPRFTFSQNTITGVDCNSGTTDIYAYYSDTIAGTATATATVYNDVYNRTFTVKGVIEKADQLITWHNDILRLGQSYTDVATANTLVTYESEDESIIRVDEDDEGHKTILTAVGTGTVNITATAVESSFYAEKSSTKGIKVTEKQIQWIDWNQSLFGLKLGGANVTMNAVAASDVEGCVSSRLIEYSSNNDTVVKVVNNNQLQIVGVGTAIITTVQAGGFDTDGHDYERAETEKTVIVRDPNAPCESFAYQQGQEVKMDCGWNALDKQTRTSEINFNGIIPATGTLRYKGEYRKVAINYFDGTMTVEQYIPGEDWKPVTGGDLGKPAIGTYKTANLTFDRRATKMRVKVTDGLGYHYFTDCQVTQARFIETTAPVDFNLNVGQQQNQVIYLSYSNITDGLSLTLAQGANSHFSVDTSFIEGSCGSAAKNVALTITYHPTAEETNAQDVLTITDGTTSCQVVLTGSATRVNRHINWDHADETDIYTVQTETLSAEARTDLNELAGVVTFSLASSSTATGAISMENVLSFTSAGVANVVAYTKDDARFNAAPNVTKVFNVSKTPTIISTLPTLQGTVYGGTAAEDVMLTGGVAINTVNSGTVNGTFEVISPTTLNAGTYTLTVQFTPEDENMYTGCTATLENVTIAQRTPEESELGVNVGTIIYGQRIDEASMTNSGSLAGTWYWKDEDANKEVKAVGTYDNLNVYFVPENTNYATVYSTVSVTVEKATPEVTAQASAITYGQAISASELSTATGNISGTWAWAVDEEQVLSVGDHVLTANFTSTNANYSDLSNVDVTLTVNKIEKLEVPVALSFCAGESVNFHGNTYSEAGEYQVEAEGEIRDTVYNVTVTKLQPTTGTDSKTITVGANDSWNGNDLSGYAIGSHEVVFHTENVAGCDSTVTLSLTVVPLSNVFTNAEGDGDWGNANNWESGIVPTSDPDIIVTGALEIKESITVGSLTIEQTGSVSVISGGTLTVKGVSETRAEYGDVHVLNDGALALINSANLQVRHFTLDAKLAGKNNANVKEAAASGQVENPNQLAINGDAYFQMAFDPKGKISFGWYDFVVPFPMNISDGIYRAGDLTNHLVSGVDFIVQEYSETKCANGQKAWSNFSGTMQPGRVYTIGFNYRPDFDQNVFVFKKADGANIGASTVFATQYTEGSGDPDDFGWNGLGNGMLQHGYITGEFSHIQVYNHAENKYDILTGKTPTFAIGTSFFVQVDEEAPEMTWHAAEADEDHPLYAPKREAIEVEEFLLSLREESQVDACDYLYISASEEATEAYVIGHDLRKMGNPTEAKTAQMWTTKGGKNLCDIETRMVNYKASSDLYFFAPQATTFELTAEEMPENATLYLTKNGKAIWNLSMSSYELNLEQGTTEGYGLRIVASQQTTTDIENGGLLNDANGVRKVMIDNVIYIVTPEGKMYDIVGKGIKF